MANKPSGKSLREDLRDYARKSGERQMDLLRIDRKGVSENAAGELRCGAGIVAIVSLQR